jgi:hypothetical protein
MGSEPSGRRPAMSQNTRKLRQRTRGGGVQSCRYRWRSEGPHPLALA